MRGKIKLTLMALVMMACSKEGPTSEMNFETDSQLVTSHEQIVLGERLENPYKTENITKALSALYPTKSACVDVSTTDLYVRFLPKTQEEYDTLSSLGLRLIDYPVDYEIKNDGDWYHDPEIPEGNITWQYAVVPVDFKFPDIKYEVIDECYISENDEATKSMSGIDWEAVERQAYVITGNESMLAPQSKAASSRPKGRITIVDKHYKGGAAFGVAGVNVSCNTFVKFDDTYTDKDGYYEMSKKFSSDVKYRLIFQNQKKFSIGLNLVLVQASVASLGKASPSGKTMTVNKDSADKLFKKCAVNNAVYDYIERCASMNITPPPTGLRIWVFHNLRASCAVMMRQGAVVDNSFFKTFLGEYAGLLRIFFPDITLGLRDADDYRDIYSLTCHELAHASHFAKVKTDYWNKYVKYIVKSFFASGGKTYGNGTGTGAGHCEVGEMWAYYLESLMFKERYGGDFPTFGNSMWFKPEILRYLHKKGFTASNIFSTLDASSNSKDNLEKSLISKFPSKSSQIVQAFDKY